MSGTEQRGVCAGGKKPTARSINRILKLFESFKIRTAGRKYFFDTLISPFNFSNKFSLSTEYTVEKVLGQHRTIWQEHSAKDFASYESYKRAGILYVFPPFITARMGQKIGRRPQTQLCGDALDLKNQADVQEETEKPAQILAKMQVGRADT